MIVQAEARSGDSLYQRGSEWRKWDLHIHTPGTAREDEYTGWPDFIHALKATKDVSVVGVTDYLSIANYEELIRQKKDAKFGSIDLFIPNVEFRVTPQTDRGHAVNLHLLIDPTEPAHCDEINHALARLSIEYQRQPYSCTQAGIAKLGVAYNPSLIGDDAQYREGVNQFKVDFAVFWKWYDSEVWLRQHSLVCAAGGNDGPSGIKDSGWAAKQEEIWRSAHIIFSANQNNRAFWLAEGGDKSDGAKKLGAPKPCFHGSDAHCLDDLFKPSAKGFCWIKADPTFEGLRQTLYEPKERVHIGQQPPVRHDASKVISEIAIGGGGTAAFQKLKLGLNSGLVTIIGEKGSGKSALTDLLAYAAGKDVSSDRSSFISRASEYLSGTAVTLTWLDGHISSAVIGDNAQRRASVRYLPQSFVERLCSEDYAGTELANEIERVIFSNLDPTDTLNTSSFSELRGVKTQVLAAERVKLTSKIRELIAEDETLRDATKSVPAKKDNIEALGKELTGLNKQLPSAETPEEAEAQKQLPVLRQELQKLQATVAGLKQRQLKLQQLRAKLDQFKADFEASRQDFLAEAKDLGVAKRFDLELNIKGEDALDDLGAVLALQIAQLEGKAPAKKNGQERTIKTVAKQIEEIEKRVASDQARRNQKLLLVVAVLAVVPSACGQSTPGNDRRPAAPPSNQAPPRSEPTPVPRGPEDSSSRDTTSGSDNVDTLAMVLKECGRLSCCEAKTMIDEVPEAAPSRSHTVRNVVLVVAAIYVVASLYLMWDMHGRLAKVESTTATNYDKLARKIAENEASAKASQQAIAKQVGMTEEQLARRTAELQRQQRAAESRLIEQGQQLGQVTGEVAGVKGEVAGVKGDVGTVRTDLETTKGKLERAIGDLGQQSGLIAHTRDDLEVLKHKGDRNYYEFTLTKSKGKTPVSTVSLQLKKTDPKRGKFTLNVIADDRTIEKKDRTVYEPLQFYTGRDRLLYELVVFTVAKDKVSGYISTPKNAPTAPSGN